MTDHHSAIDQALDLVLYAPLGLAVTIAEELPELAQKGRARLGQRTAAARLIGQLAVAEGRRRLRKSAFSGLVPTGAARRPAAGTGPGPTPGTEPDKPGGGSGTPSTGGGGPAATVRGGGGESAATAARGVTPAAPPATPRDGAGGPAAVVRAAGTAPASGELAIPGYDSLSASQVVQRLASLSGEELEAVRAYEAANRGRRTILARVAQLQRA